MEIGEIPKVCLDSPVSLMHQLKLMFYWLFPCEEVVNRADLFPILETKSQCFKMNAAGLLTEWHERDKKTGKKMNKYAFLHLFFEPYLIRNV